jgi:SM-20-related protein
MNAGDHLAIADALHQQGWWMGQHGLNQDVVKLLEQEAKHAQHSGAMQLAGIGRGNSRRLDSNRRSDKIIWMDGVSGAQKSYFAQMELLRLAINRQLFLGLFDYESHFAFYAPGAFYKKHSDSFQGAAGRIVSVVIYLNTEWLPASGGQLVLYDAGTPAKILLSVLPEAGVMVVFLSEQIPHEVLAALRDRYSMAGWFRLSPP